jgi:hypothetical protein
MHCPDRDPIAAVANRFCPEVVPKIRAAIEQAKQ